MLKLGEKSISKLYLGNKAISKAYFGDKLVFSGKNYTELEYLESTGTQYIDTGITYSTSNSYVIEQDLVVTQQPSTSTQIYGSGWNAGGGLMTYTNTQVGKWLDGTAATVYGSIYNRTQVTITINAGYSSTTDYVVVNGGETITGTRPHTGLGTYAKSAGYPLMATTTSSATISGNLTGKIYSTMITVNGTLTRDLIPVLDKDGVACMYDKVTEQFFYNKGTGEFLYG